MQESRKEQNNQLHTFGEQVDSRLFSIQRANTENIEKINTTLENKMKELQESNEKRLEQIQSFELVSKQFESVGQGLGEMKALAADAKPLKKRSQM